MSSLISLADKLGRRRIVTGDPLRASVELGKIPTSLPGEDIVGHDEHDTV